MKTSKATQECKLKSLIELLLNRCGTRVHRNCSQTTAFHVTHLTTLLRSFWRKFLEKSVANCDKNVLVVSAKQDIPRFYQTWHNKVCVGRRCKPRRRVSEIFLKVTTNNHLTWSPSVDRRVGEISFCLRYWARQRYGNDQHKQSPTVSILQAEQKEIAACTALGIRINIDA